MRTWEKIYKEKLSEGYSDDSAYNFATQVMNERRLNFDPYSVVGMEENSAKEKLDENGYSFRVVSRDIGSVGPIHLDLRRSRCNVVIKRGQVSEIKSLG